MNGILERSIFAYMFIHYLPSGHETIVIYAKTAAAVWAPDQSRHMLRKPQSGYEAVVVQLRSLTGAGHTGVGGLLFLLGFLSRRSLAAGVSNVQPAGFTVMGSLLFDMPPSRKHFIH